MRLIDADAFERYMQNEWENNRLCNEAWITFREMLKACPTIDAIVLSGGGIEPGNVVFAIKETTHRHTD